METIEVIELLNEIWGPEGDNAFLWHFRQGDFIGPKAEMSLAALRRIGTDQFGDALPREVVSLLWWIPLVLEWNIGRVTEKGGDTREASRYSNLIQAEVQRILDGVESDVDSVHRTMR